jgi:hydroxyacylglutathione hydrolase
MIKNIKTINTGVNCYLIKTDAGYILIDTGFVNKRPDLEKALESAGCRQGDLKLIIITHGDIDHAGNAAYLRERYGAKIAMHKDDSVMVENANMSLNRKAKPDKLSLWFRIIGMLFGNPGKFDRFKPDMYVEDGQELSEFGFDAKVLHIPGHSKGSIGILTADGDLFFGDLLANFFKPGFHPYIDDLKAANSSIQKLRKFDIKMIYPGHGKPFPIDRIIK